MFHYFLSLINVLRSQFWLEYFPLHMLYHEDKLPAYAFYFFSAVLISRIEYGVQCLKIELKSPVKAISATIHFKGELFTRFAARAIIASTPNVVRNRRSKPPTFSSKNNFLRFVGQNPPHKRLYIIDSFRCYLIFS